MLVKSIQEVSSSYVCDAWFLPRNYKQEINKKEVAFFGCLVSSSLNILLTNYN